MDKAPPPSQELLDAMHAIANHTSVVMYGLAALRPFIRSAKGAVFWRDCDRASAKLVASVRHAQELVRNG